jgi:hypothetical protein
VNGNQTSEHVSQRPLWSNQRIACVRVGVGIWLLILTAILYGAGVGGPWEVVLVAVAALHFGLAYRASRVANDDPDQSLMFR